jgi:hypothetical protein
LGWPRGCCGAAARGCTAWSSPWRCGASQGWGCACPRCAGLFWRHQACMWERRRGYHVVQRRFAACVAPSCQTQPLTHFRPPESHSGCLPFDLAQELRDRCVVVMRHMARDEAAAGAPFSASTDLRAPEPVFADQQATANPPTGRLVAGPELDGRTLVTLLRALALTGEQGCSSNGTCGTSGAAAAIFTRGVASTYRQGREWVSATNTPVHKA